MPYIAQITRDHLAEGHPPSTPGELNYAITRLLVVYAATHGLSYDTIADCISSCEGAKLEFYRRIAGPYEDAKMRENGDVYVAGN
jgi:hypothetical protein